MTSASPAAATTAASARGSEYMPGSPPQLHASIRLRAGAKQAAALRPSPLATRCRDSPCSSVEQGQGGRCHPPDVLRGRLGHDLVAEDAGTVASAATVSEQRDCRYENSPPSS